MADHHPPRPVRRPWHAVTALDDVAITTWVLDPDRLERALPEGFTAERFDVGGDEVALASAVSFVDRDFRFRGMPLVRLSGGQVNHRCYVRRRGVPGVWFVGTTLDHRLVRVAQVAWSMPWHRERVQIDGAWVGGRCSSMSVDVDGGWGALSVRLEEAPAAPAGPGAGLWASTVTDPVQGWYRRRDGGVGRYSVWHPPLRGRLQPMAVRAARSQPFEDLGLVPLGQEAVAAAVVPTTTFDVHTPPRRC